MKEKNSSYEKGRSIVFKVNENMKDCFTHVSKKRFMSVTGYLRYLMNEEILKEIDKGDLILKEMYLANSLLNTNDK